MQRFAAAALIGLLVLVSSANAALTDPEDDASGIDVRALAPPTESGETCGFKLTTPDGVRHSGATVTKHRDDARTTWGDSIGYGGQAAGLYTFHLNGLGELNHLGCTHFEVYVHQDSYEQAACFTHSMKWPIGGVYDSALFGVGDPKRGCVGAAASAGVPCLAIALAGTVCAPHYQAVNDAHGHGMEGAPMTATLYRGGNVIKYVPFEDIYEIVDTAGYIVQREYERVCGEGATWEECPFLNEVVDEIVEFIVGCIEGNEDLCKQIIGALDCLEKEDSLCQQAIGLVIGEIQPILDCAEDAVDCTGADELAPECLENTWKNCLDPAAGLIAVVMQIINDFLDDGVCNSTILTELGLDGKPTQIRDSICILIPDS